MEVSVAGLLRKETNDGNYYRMLAQNAGGAEREQGCWKDVAEYGGCGCSCSGLFGSKIYYPSALVVYEEDYADMCCLCYGGDVWRNWTRGEVPR